MSDNNKFWCFNQNNSGGSFVIDAARGLGHYVIVEASNVSDAHDRALRIGIYFGGPDDCPCCGDRWHPAYGREGDALPSVYGTPVWGKTTIFEETLAFIHYLDGTVERVDVRYASGSASKEVDWELIPEKWRDRIENPEGRAALGLDT